MTNLDEILRDGEKRMRYAEKLFLEQFSEEECVGINCISKIYIDDLEGWLYIYQRSLKQGVYPVGEIRRMAIAKAKAYRECIAECRSHAYGTNDNKGMAVIED